MDYSQQAQEEFNELVKGLSPEDKERTKQAMVEMQKQLVLHEPWTIAHLDDETREKILEQFTPEEQEQMAVRCELEHQRCKETGKGLGDG